MKKSFVESVDAEKLLMNIGFEKIYSEEVKSNGGNSAKISCSKRYVGQEALVFILKPKEESPSN